MKTNIFIPKIIHVGYQERDDTYTGKLAYVIYTDDKGKKRKEISWNNWRDADIKPDDFDNVPTSGFVLNKNVGDYGNGWDHRHAYIRVYDPRNFEFEISVENLIYILENTSSIKGKGLEGEFIYGWDGKDLVLMPTDTPDYREIESYNKKIFNNLCIKGKDLKVGATYISRNNEKLVYMGRFDYYDEGFEYTLDDETHRVAHERNLPDEVDPPYTYNRHNRVQAKRVEGVFQGKNYWFCNINQYERYKNNDWKYLSYIFCRWKSIPKNLLISVVSEDATPEYADMYSTLESYYKFSPYDPSKDEFVEYATLDEFIKARGNCSHKRFISDITGEYRVFELIPEDNRLYDKHKYSLAIQLDTKGRYGLCHDMQYFTGISGGQIEDVNSCDVPVYQRKYGRSRLVPMPLEHIFMQMKFMYRKLYLESGKEWRISYDSVSGEY